MQLRKSYLRIKYDPQRTEYTDSAMTVITEDETAREIFHTDAAQAYIEQQRRLPDARYGASM